MNTPAQDRVWDAGLQPERTNLAWRRAAVAFLTLALATPRVAWSALGAWSFLPAGIVLIGAAALVVAGHARYGRVHQRLTTGSAHHLPDGKLPALAAGLAGLLALLAVVLLVSSASRPL